MSMRKLCLILLLVVACGKSDQIADSTVGKEGGEPHVSQAEGKEGGEPIEARPSTNNPNLPAESTGDPNKPRIAKPIPMEEQPVRYRQGGETWARGGNVDALPAVMELKLGADGYYRDRQGRRVLLTIVEDDAKPASPGR
jgi:hypothetical protein